MKQTEIVGLYLNPPENALVLSLDERSGMQALGRKYPNKPMRPGYPERMESHYVRYGTKSLIAALAVHKGEVMGKCYDPHRHEEFLDFLGEIERTYTDKDLHLYTESVTLDVIVVEDRGRYAGNCGLRRFVFDITMLGDKGSEAK